ncbi:fasciclin-like arabinogalactan protein 19 [Durio zibethinus]|uniref:Fasciclin-like arabinogalactan protein 19 n=1 Tax=Durio zibethinus TaxID=66656 RepID=A0A6P5WZ33_DURZI|nr:fasciclin-like arabinogalactan protein 19 [Durio zibethinus]
MTKYPLFFLLFLFSISAFAAEHHHRRPLPPPPSPLHQHQLNNIIDALIGAGDFNNWANMLSAYDLLMLPLSATLFVPSDDSFFPFPVPTSSTTAASFDPFVVPYHIVPQRLTFSQLTLFKPFSRLPTLLPSKSILITNRSLSNFTLDASRISYPDLYLTSAIAVHGIAALLNYTVYGGDAGLVHGIAPPPPPPPPMFEPVGEVKGDRRRSDAGCLNREFAFVLLLIPWVVWGIKIYGIPLGL